LAGRAFVVNAREASQASNEGGRHKQTPSSESEHSPPCRVRLATPCQRLR
jgi:hypothetical protein